MEKKTTRNNAFLEAWDAVFDGDGNIRSCGREATKALIRLADGIEPSVRHGNPETGFMDLDAMRALYRAEK